MNYLSKHFANKQFLLFLMTGGVSALINFLSRFVYNQWVSFSAAIMLSYLTGVIVAFLLAKLFVFKQSHRSLFASFLIFSLVNVFAALQTLIVTLGLVYYILPKLHIILFAKELAHAIGIATPIFSSYFGHKHWTFGEKKVLLKSENFIKT